MSALPVWAQCRLEDLPGDHEWTPLARESVLSACTKLVQSGATIDAAVHAIELAFSAGMTVRMAATNVLG